MKVGTRSRGRRGRSGALLIAVAGPAEAQQCRRNYYPCSANKNGVLDPLRPGCCLSDIRLKRDIVKLATRGDGIGIYRFRYIWSDQTWSDQTWSDQAWSDQAWSDQAWSDQAWGAQAWSDQAYVGVMAQQVQTVMPEAVLRGAGGYLRVNYDKVGVRFQTWEAWALR